MINKNLLASFISKYYLNGRFNQVKWRIKDKNVWGEMGEGHPSSTRFPSGNQVDDLPLVAIPKQ